MKKGNTREGLTHEKRYPRRRDYPKKLYIGSAIYTVKFRKFRERGLYGKTNPESKTIYLNSNLSPSELYATFIHEILHALLEFEHGFVRRHRDIYRLESILVEFLVSNFL